MALGYKTGGKQKGYQAPHTLAVAESRKQLIAMYQQASEEINETLITLAKNGDIQAIKELHDRVYGKSLQTNENIITRKYRLDDPELEKTANELSRLYDRTDTGSPRT